MWLSRRSRPRASRGLGVELDDEALVDLDRERDLAPLRRARQRPGDLPGVAVQIGRRVGGELQGLPDEDEGPSSIGEVDGLAPAGLRRGHVHPTAVDLYVPIGGELAGP